MFIAQKEGTVYFLTEIRLCCVCCRMFDRNVTSHAIAFKDGFSLFSHIVCPPTKNDGSHDERRKISR